MLYMRRERILLRGWVIGSGRLEGRLYYIASKSSFDYSFTQGVVWKELFHCENLGTPREEIVFLKWRSLNNLSWYKDPSPSWRKKLAHTLTLIDMTRDICRLIHEKGQLHYSSRKETEAQRSLWKLQSQFIGRYTAELNLTYPDVLSHKRM